MTPAMESTANPAALIMIAEKTPAPAPKIFPQTSMLPCVEARVVGAVPCTNSVVREILL